MLIDEFDKVNPSLYNKLYQLFDEGRYVDTNYGVDARNRLFLLMSNFFSESGRKKAMGEPIFSRINANIEYTDLSTSAKKR